jgi:V/A-type H+-transporting ATPase subunit E
MPGVPPSAGCAASAASDITYVCEFKEIKMAEELKALIEKIQAEGVQAAEKQAANIIEEARHRAAGTLAQARAEAEKLISEAKAKISRMEESSRTSLKQAGRDLLISLRKEINAILKRLAETCAKEALSVEELKEIIPSLIKECTKSPQSEIVISLNNNDLKKLQEGLLGKLKEEVRKGITLKADDDIRAGFVISYDAGKSHYEFTDQALAEYIMVGLEPKLQQILKEIEA